MSMTLKHYLNPILHRGYSFTSVTIYISHSHNLSHADNYSAIWRANIHQVSLFGGTFTLAIMFVCTYWRFTVWYCTCYTTVCSDIYREIAILIHCCRRYNTLLMYKQQFMLFAGNPISYQEISHFINDCFTMGLSMYWHITLWVCAIRTRIVCTEQNTELTVCELLIAMA